MATSSTHATKPPTTEANVQSHRPDAAIAQLAARQHGVVARRQLAELGLSRRAIEHRPETGRLHRLHRGVYAVGHRATHATRQAFEQDRARDRATRAAGHMVLRITARQLGQQRHEIARQLRSTLTQSP